jgi:hypothetical protein
VNILKSLRNCSNAKLLGAIALIGTLGALVGAAVMNEYAYRVDRPKWASYGNYEGLANLTFAVDSVYDRSDKRQDAALEYLSLKGSSIAYLQRISRARHAAFKGSNLSYKKFDEASIDAVDTRAADALLLEAMDHLSDHDLYWLLRMYVGYFSQSDRANIRSRLDKNDYDYPSGRFGDLQQLHNTLTELERSKLQDCYKKLEDTRPEVTDDEKISKAGMCSEKTEFKPYIMWDGQAETLSERFKRSIGLDR